MARVISHADEIGDMIDSNIVRALNAMGKQGVGFIVSQMETGYNEPHMTYSSPYIGDDPDIPKGRTPTGSYHTAIYDTGDLEGSIAFDVNASRKTVDIGTPKDYAVYVHEGTYKLNGRPFIRDAMKKNIKRLIHIAKSYLANGFD